MKYCDLFAKQGISLNRLHTLVLVDEAGSIAAAAPDDRNRQSLFSRQLNELERVFSVALKRTQGRTIQLTPAGRELAAVARRSLDELDAFYRNGLGRAPDLSLGAGDSVLQWLVLPHLPRLRASLPGIVWHLHQTRNAEMVRRLHEESLDFGVLCSDLVPSHLQSRPLGGSFGYALFVPRGLGATAEMPELTQALATLPIAKQDDDVLLHEMLDAVLRESRLSLNVGLSCDSLDHVVQAVVGGAYAGVLPDRMSRLPSLAGARTIPIEGGSMVLRRTLSLAWNPQRMCKQLQLEKVREVLHQQLNEACRWKATTPMN